MPSTPVNAWDARALAASESAFGTAVAPVAAQALEIISIDLGNNEVGKVRPKRDRSIGRGMQSEWIEGDVEPMDFSVLTSLKSRSAIDAAPKELALYKAAGLDVTTNAATSVVLSMSSTPIESGDFASATLSRFLGSGAGLGQAEVLRGCVVKKLNWSGGNKEVELAASGSGIGKEVLGVIDSITLASGVVTSVTITAQESYRLGLGYYICESEIIQVTAVTPGATSATIVRGALSSSAVAHTAKPLYPYYPPSVTFSGSPIAEPEATVTLGGINPLLVTEWSVDLTTGLDLLPHETSSRYVAGAKQVRYDVTVKMKLVLRGDRVDLQGMAKGRPNVALLLSQGLAVGGVVGFAAPNCEVMPFKVPDTANDIAMVDVVLRVRDGGTASDALTLTLT
jgi:hypothetical protein